MRTRAIEFGGVLVGGEVSDAWVMAKGDTTYPEGEAAVGAVRKRLKSFLLSGRAVERAESCEAELDDSGSEKAF